MMRNKSSFVYPIIVFSLLLFVYMLTFSGFSSTDDEQLFSALTENLAHGRDYSALPLFGNDRLQGTASGVEPLHPILGIPLCLLADKFGLGKVQVLYLLPALYTALTAALLVAISEKKEYPAKTSLLLGLAYGLGTIAFPYARTNFREPLAALLITTSLIWVEISVEEDQKKWKKIFYPIVGLIFLGLVSLTKITTATVIPFLAFLYIDRKKALGKEKISKWILPTFFSLIVLILIGYLLLSFLPTNSINRFTFRFFDYIRFTLPRLPHDHFWSAIAGLLISPGKGLFIYSPVLLLILVSPFIKRRISPDWVVYIGALLSLTVVQALIYNDHWWSITWGTRALLPSLPFVCLAALPALNAGFNHKNMVLRFFTFSLLAISGCAQIGRLLTSDPVYTNWVVQYTGRGIDAMMQWDLHLAPMLRHWWLAGNSQASDIAWFYINKDALVLFLLLVLFLSIGSLICIFFLIKKDSRNPVFISIITSLILIVLVLTPVSAQFDQRYNKDVIVFREISDYICKKTQSGDLVLIDAYLKPFWWYYSNFGCSKPEWVSLPYLHQTAINSEQFFPRISEISSMVQYTLFKGKQVFLIQSPPELTLSYEEEIKKAGFFVKLMNVYTNPNMQIYMLK
ncbi:MAG: hypothetical protein Q7J07_01520 [Pelolinea sp.]|nr:hypothetical protein [Pelolinea sp.]